MLKSQGSLIIYLKGGKCMAGCGCNKPYPIGVNNLILFLLLIILVGDCLCSPSY